MKAIEILQKIAEQIEQLDKKVDVLDRNIKQLMNQKIEIPQIRATASASVSQKDEIFDFHPKAMSRPKMIKVFGYVKRTGGIPISDISVTLWNDKDEEVIKRITNSNGYWEGRLPPGKYALEYRGENVRSINKVILLDNNMEQFEVL